MGTMGPQYLQNVDNSVWVARPALVPGLRGRALPIGAYPDYLTEIGLGGMLEINRGYQFVYEPQRIASFTPAEQRVNLYRNGRFVETLPNYSFKAQRIEELSTRTCS